MVFQRGNILNNIFALKIVESHLAPGWNYRIYIGLLIIPVLAICRSLSQILIKYFLKYKKKIWMLDFCIKKLKTE